MTTASRQVYQVNTGYNKSHIVKLSDAEPYYKDDEIIPGEIDITCTCCFIDDYNMLCKHAVAVLQHIRENPSNFKSMVHWYSIATYRNTYQYPMDPIRLEDFKDLKVYTQDSEYRDDDPFAQQVEVIATAPRLAQLRGRPKKRRIRKATKGKPKRQLKCGYCKQVGHNRRGCRNRRKQPEVVLLNSSTDEESASSGSATKASEACSESAAEASEAGSESAVEAGEASTSNQVEVSSDSEVNELA